MADSKDLPAAGEDNFSPRSYYSLRGHKMGKELEDSLRRSYISNRGVIKEYVVCVPIDHTAKNKTPPLQNGVIMEFTSYDQTTSFPLFHESIGYNPPMKAELAREITTDLNRDGSPVFRGYVFGDMEKFLKVPLEKLPQFLANEVAKNQYISDQ